LTGGEEGVLAASLANHGYDEARKNVEKLASVFGRQNVYVELQRHCDSEEERRNQAAVRLAETLNLPLLATNGVRYATAAERELLDVFTCIRNHAKLETAGRLLERSDERLLRSGKAITLQAARELAHKFDTSLAATAIRLVQHGSFPAMVVYLSEGRRRWFVAGPDVPSVLSPREIPSKRTLAWELMQVGSNEPGPTTVQADGWLTHPEAEKYELLEDSVRFRDGSILSLLWWKDEKQIIDLIDVD
jgi:hypothetical protein